MTRLLREHPAIDAELDADGPPGRDPLERPPGARRGLQPLARGGVVVAGADRAGLLQGGGAELAGPRVPRPDRRHVAPGAALRLSALTTGMAATGRTCLAPDRQRTAGDPRAIETTSSTSEHADDQDECARGHAVESSAPLRPPSMTGLRPVAVPMTPRDPPMLRRRERGERAGSGRQRRPSRAAGRAPAGPGPAAPPPRSRRVFGSMRSFSFVAGQPSPPAQPAA